ncbi:amino acid permease [Salmonella enterica subsp. enterica]|uniref:Amino acid permease n=1 Tax=Salmonella enterica I TaxID=59201 RepID=A0A447TP93_SALET|nr:amino acid permease [Salmonella enterica subsp. enterica]
MTTLNANGMPATAMWLQCVLVSLFILLVSFGGDTASAFYNKLTLMAKRLNDLAIPVPCAGISLL